MVVRAVNPEREVTEAEARLLAILRGAADQSMPAPKTDDLADAIGVSNGGTISDMLRRLNDMGKIELRSFQRGRQICFPDGVCTARPLGAVPHWRDRPQGVPTVSVAVLRHRRPGIADEIMAWAERRGVPICDAIADLTFVGWQVEKERC